MTTFDDTVAATDAPAKRGRGGHTGPRRDRRHDDMRTEADNLSADLFAKLGENFGITVNRNGNTRNNRVLFDVTINGHVMGDLTMEEVAWFLAGARAVSSLFPFRAENTSTEAIAA